MHRVFCATAWELEGERMAFQTLVGEFNENEAMKHGLLYVPVTLTNIMDKRPFTYVIDENIRDSRHYILVPCDNWGPEARNFERDYELAQVCAADPALPMRETAILVKKPLSGRTLPPVLDQAPQFSTVDEFRALVRQLLSTWLETLLAESPQKPEA